MLHHELLLEHDMTLQGHDHVPALQVLHACILHALAACVTLCLRTSSTAAHESSLLMGTDHTWLKIAWLSSAQCDKSHDMRNMLMPGYRGAIGDWSRCADVSFSDQRSIACVTSTCTQGLSKLSEEEEDLTAAAVWA